MSVAKEKYNAFVRNNYVPIFYREVFLDIVCDDFWDVTLYEEEGKIRAAYIFMKKQKYFLNYIVQPKLCPYTGPLFFNPKEVKKAYSYLLDHLPNHQVIIQDYFHDLPMLEGFKHTDTTKHTHIFEADLNVDLLWEKQSINHRRVIRRAQKQLRYEEEEDMDVFLNFVNTTFQKRNKKVPNDPAVFKKLDMGLAKGGNRKIVKCTNDQNRIVAMCYFIKDEKWTYNMASSVVQDYKHYGINLIMWNEITATLKEGRSFDFEGSMIPGIDTFFSRFKGTKKMYYSRYKASNRLVDLLVRMKINRDK